VRVITSPDNSFVPGGSLPSRTTHLRGVTAVLAQAADTVEVATGPVVVSIHAKDARLAAAAAQTMVPINGVGAPYAPLPKRLPDSGFAETPLPGQTPPPLQVLPWATAAAR
jgi:hypothetical protein